MFDAKLKEAVGYFEQMLKVMPDDSHTLEFLSVAYSQLGETEKSERALAELARILLKQGDLKGASALMPRLEAATAPEAQAMVVRIRAAEAPRPELVPERAADDSTVQAPSSSLQPALEAEASFAEALGEADLAASIRELPDTGRPYLVSALALLEREKPDAFDAIVARLAEETGVVPIPLDAFEPDRQLAAKLPAGLVRIRGVIPFARLGETALVVTLSPGDEALRRKVEDALACPVHFYLAEPRHVEAAIQKLFPEDA